MTETNTMPLRRVLFRNGFGFDIEIVTHLPLWTWAAGEDPTEDDPGIGVFEGFVINIPFLKIFIGELAY